MTAFDPQTKLLCHSGLLDDWKKPPVSVEISPTNFCSAKCPWCWFVSAQYKQKHSREWIPWPIISRLLREFDYLDVEAVAWTGGGDPATYASIDSAIAAAML